MLNPKSLLNILPAVLLSFVQVGGISEVARSQPPESGQIATTAPSPQVRDRQFTTAFAIARSIQAPENRASALKSIAKTMLKTNHYDELGISPIETMLQETLRLPNGLTKSDILSDLAIMTRRHNNQPQSATIYRTALEAIRANPDPLIRGNVLVGIAIEVLKLGDRENAQRLLTEATPDIQRLSNANPQIETKIRLLNLQTAAYIRLNDRTTAQALLSQTQQLLNTQSGINKALLISETIPIDIKLNDSDTAKQRIAQAIASLDAIPSQPSLEQVLVPTMYRRLATQYHQLNAEVQQIALLEKAIDQQVDKAGSSRSAFVDTFRGMGILPMLPMLSQLQDQAKAAQIMGGLLQKFPNPKPKAKAGDISSYDAFLAAFAQQATNFSDRQQARSLLEQSLNAAQKLDEPGQKSRVLTVIAASYAKIGDRPRAQALLEQAQALALTDQKTNNYTAAILARGYVFIDDQPRAYQIIEQLLKGNRPRTDFVDFNHIMETIVMLEPPEQKRQFFAQVTPLTPQLKTNSEQISRRLSLAQSYAELGDRATGQMLLNQAIQQATQSTDRKDACTLAANRYYIEQENWNQILKLSSSCDDSMKGSIISELLGEYTNQRPQLAPKDRIFASLNLIGTLYTQFDNLISAAFLDVTQVWEPAPQQISRSEGVNRLIESVRQIFAQGLKNVQWPDRSVEYQYRVMVASDGSITEILPITSASAQLLPRLEITKRIQPANPASANTNVAPRAFRVLVSSDLIQVLSE